MKNSVPERVRWAVEVLNIKPSDRVLEIGPGPGVAAALIAERLGKGRLVAIDRSAVAVRRTLGRNRDHVETGKVDVRHSSLEEFDGRGGSFDKVFAINVNLFWVRDAAAELDLIAGLLAPGGALYLFYEAPGSTKEREISDRVRRALRAAGYRVTSKKASAAFVIVGKGR